MRNDKESPFSLTLTESDVRLQVLRFNGREALNQPYHFDLELIGLAPPMSLDTLLEQAAFLRLDGESGVHGMVHSVSLSAHALHRIGYRLTLVPYLQRLEGEPRRRVFYRLSVPQILRRLLEDHALPSHSYRFELPHGHYPCRPLCIQYEESDLELLQRLCEEEGIHYHFEHSPCGHVLVFAEDPKSFPAQPVEMTLLPGTGPALQRLYQRHRAATPAPPSGYSDRALVNGEPTAANHPLEGDSLETLRDHPARLHRYQAGRRDLERLRCRQRQIHGQSTQPALRSAHIVQICDHPVSTFNDQWLITEVQHRGRQFSILEANRSPAPPSRDYRNRFSAIPWATVFRPALRHPKPSIPGYHLAHVLGPAGRPARLDERGQVTVSLWTLEDEGIALPVSRPRLNDRTPLMGGSEVLVSFLDGDPDRPVLCPGLLGPGMSDTGNGRAVAPAQPSAPGNSDTELLFDWLLNPPDITP